MDKIVKWAVAEWIIIQSELTGRMDKIAKWADWQNGQQCKVSSGNMDNNAKWDAAELTRLQSEMWQNGLQGNNELWQNG